MIPRYLPHFTETGDWTSIAWWIHEHVPDYSSMYFFPELCAFNINWYEDQSKPKSIRSYVDDLKLGIANQYCLMEKFGTLMEMSPEERYSACHDILEKN